MSCWDWELEELELDIEHNADGLAALLHTVLFMRTGEVAPPVLGECPSLIHFCYAKCCSMDVDAAVQAAVDGLQVRPVGPNVSRGTLTLSLFHLGTRKNLFGMVSVHRRCYERWHIPVVVTDELSSLMGDVSCSSSSSSCSSNSSQATAREAYLRVVRSAREALASRIHFIMRQRRGAIPIPTQVQAQAQAQAQAPKLMSRLHSLLSSSRLTSTPAATAATPSATLATDVELIGLPRPGLLAFEITSGDSSAPTGLGLLAKLVTRSVRPTCHALETRPAPGSSHTSITSITSITSNTSNASNTSIATH